MKPIFQHVTVAVDGSTTSDRGVTFALELARDGGRLSFCSVVDPMRACVPVIQGAVVDGASMLMVLDDDAAAFCRQAQGEAEKRGIACDSRVLHGPCVDEISSFSVRNSSDAIVIGTHGRTGLARMLLGSVAAGVVQHSKIPVVCVHSDDEMRTGALAVALDSSEAAQAALCVGLAIAAARGIPSILLYVGSLSARSVAVNALLARATEHARARGVPTRLVLREGDVAAELIAAANAEDCCMIVIGTHGHTPIAGFMLGSVAAAVVANAQVPVVTVRSAA